MRSLKDLYRGNVIANGVFICTLDIVSRSTWRYYSWQNEWVKEQVEFAAPLSGFAGVSNHRARPREPPLKCSERVSSLLTSKKGYGRGPTAFRGRY
jgi:hypothetical protein